MAGVIGLLDPTDAMLQPGGGVVLWLHRRIGTQVSLHYRRTLGRSLGTLDLPAISELRFAVGVTIGLGGGV